MELSVMSPVLNQMGLEESLAYLSCLGVDILYRRVDKRMRIAARCAACVLGGNVVQRVHAPLFPL